MPTPEEVEPPLPLDDPDDDRKKQPLRDPDAPPPDKGGDSETPDDRPSA